MPHQALVFHELFGRFPGLAQAASAAGVELVSIEAGREIPNQVRTLSPKGVLMDVAMPQMSGIECCRQLKESLGATAPKVALFSSLLSPAMEERAVGAGCDVYAKGAEAEAMLVQFLQLLGQGAAPAVQEPIAEKRREPRISLQDRFDYSINGVEKNGWLVNASRSGILLGVEENHPVGTDLILHFKPVDAEAFDVPAKVVRGITLSEAVGGGKYTFGMGAKFGTVPETATQILDTLLSTIQKKGKETPRITLPLAREIFEADTTLIAPHVGGTTPQEGTPLAAMVGEIKPFEKEAFSNSGPLYECAQRLILLRVQCASFSEIVPLLKKEKGLLPIFLKILGGLISRTEAIESETEEHVRQAVAKGDETARQNLNEISNRLHETKMQMMFLVDGDLSAKGLGPEGDILKVIHERVAHIRSLSQDGTEAAKYDRRAPPPPPKPEEETKKPSRFKVSWKYIALTTLSALMVGTVATVNYFINRVEPDMLKIPLRYKSATISEDVGLLVYTDASAFESLSPADQDATFRGIEEAMKARKVRVGKILNENNKPIFAIMASGTAGQIEYMRRKIGDEQGPSPFHTRKK